jgi:hypothetical protein
VTQDELDAIRKRADAATPGPWTTPEKNPTDEYYASCFPADEDFIGHAREDIPALLDEIERLRVEIDRLTTLLLEHETIKPDGELGYHGSCEHGHLFVGGNPFDVSWSDLKCSRCGISFLALPLR